MSLLVIAGKLHNFAYISYNVTVINKENQKFGNLSRFHLKQEQLNFDAYHVSFLNRRFYDAG